MPSGHFFLPLIVKKRVACWLVAYGRSSNLERENVNLANTQWGFPTLSYRRPQERLTT